MEHRKKPLRFFSFFASWKDRGTKLFAQQYTPTKLSDIIISCRGTYDPFFSEDELSGYNSAWSSRGLSSHNLKKAPDNDAYVGSRSYLYSGAPSKQVSMQQARGKFQRENFEAFLG